VYFVRVYFSCGKWCIHIFSVGPSRQREALVSCLDGLALLESNGASFPWWRRHYVVTALALNCSELYVYGTHVSLLSEGLCFVQLTMMSLWSRSVLYLLCYRAMSFSASSPPASAWQDPIDLHRRRPSRSSGSHHRAAERGRSMTRGFIAKEKSLLNYSNS
jgi:hypothetical protein